MQTRLSWVSRTCFLPCIAPHACVLYRYEVRPKTKKCMEEVDKFIRESYFREAGIVYCLSRNDCEKTAQKLIVSDSRALGETGWGGGVGGGWGEFGF